MRVGLIMQLHGAPDGPRPAPTWQSISALAVKAEEVGFDSVVFEDALLYRWGPDTFGCWEASTIAAGLASSTSRIHFGPSVFNSPYRSAALTAKIAATIDEISGGRFICGIGAGNTDDYDYEAFGFPTDKRYSRFVEAIGIIHALLKEGRVDFDGAYHSARDSEMVLEGPRHDGPPIVIAASGPKMLRLVARYGDGWNWWSGNHETAAADLQPIIADLERACDEVGRDQETLERSLDLYTIDPLGAATDEHGPMLSGSSDEIAAGLLSFADLGFAEVRCDLFTKSPDAVAAMADVVAQVHATWPSETT